MTLIEVLVVVMIIAVLLGLLIVAVQSAREAARKMRCAANLRQIGIAQHSYFATHSMFTPIHMITKNNWSANRLSGFVFLLPYLEEKSLYSQINMSFANRDGPHSRNTANRTAYKSTLSIFLCPSDGEPRHRVSYRFNSSKIKIAPKIRLYGPFIIGVNPSDVTISDGLSNTAIVSERIGGGFDPQLPNIIRDIKQCNGSFYNRHPSDDSFITACVQSTSSDWNTISGLHWQFNGMANTDYNHVGTPNDPRPSCGGTNFGLHPPRSLHPGLVNVLFGDGRVTTVSNTIARAVWLKYGTHNAGD